jgi:hypothetical protein
MSDFSPLPPAELITATPRFYYTSVEELLARAAVLGLRPVDLAQGCNITSSAASRLVDLKTKPRRDTHEKLERLIMTHERLLFDALIKLPHIQKRLDAASKG